MCWDLTSSHGVYDIEKVAMGAPFNTRNGSHKDKSVNEYISHENKHFWLYTDTDGNDQTVIKLGGRVPP